MAHRKRILAWVAALGLAGCAPVMEFSRPDLIDLSQFHVGQHRLDVVKVLGAPVAAVNDGPKSCDVYQLYTNGPNGAGKAGIAFVEGAADILTLGLAEIVSTPAEAGTKNSLHAVTMCYSQSGTLLSIDEAGTRIGELRDGLAAQTPLANTAALASAPAPALPVAAEMQSAANCWKYGGAPIGYFPSLDACTQAHGFPDLPKISR